MVEFAVTCIMLFTLFGGLFDLGLAVHNYTLLKHVTAEATREAAVQMQTTNQCTNVQSYLAGPATDKLVRVLGLDGDPNFTFCYRDSGIVGSTGTYPVLRVHATAPVHCYFLCSMLPGGFTIGTTNEIVIERPEAVSACFGPQHC